MCNKGKVPVPGRGSSGARSVSDTCPVRELGPWLVVAGLALAVIGVLAWAGALSWFGRLPGDLRFGDERTRVYQ